MIFFGILDRLKAKYIFSGALLLLFLLPVLGMALPGGVQHPATPERQTPPDSTAPKISPVPWKLLGTMGV